MYTIKEVLSSSLIEHSTGSKAEEKDIFSNRQKERKKNKKNSAIFYLYYWPCRLDNNAIFDEVDAK